MITREELEALVQLLQRQPVSRAEALWASRFLAELERMVVEEELKARRGAQGEGSEDL